ncbi:Chloroperoxidase, partial [Pholiota molesta]
QTCPVTGETHGFCPPQEGDSRSPCPALNTMANHGYISRDGKNLSAGDVTRGLKECYGLSSPLAYFWPMSVRHHSQICTTHHLYEIGLHNAVEHDASLVHHDTPVGDKYAPIEIDRKLVDSLIDDARPTKKEFEHSADPDDMRRQVHVGHRLRPRRNCAGEMAIILGVWEVKGKAKAGIPVDWLRRWLTEERLPDGWKPDHVQSLRNVVARSKQIRTHFNLLKEEAAKAAVASTPEASFDESAYLGLISERTYNVLLLLGASLFYGIT